MNIYIFGWIISFILWIIFMIGLTINKEKYNFEKMSFFNTLQIFAMLSMWIFIILIFR